MIKNDRDGQINRAMVMDVIKLEKRLIAKYFAPMGRLELLVRSNGISWSISNMHIFKVIIMGKGIVDRFPKLSKIGFSMKCFTAAFSRFSGTNVNMFLLGGRLGARH